MRLREILYVVVIGLLLGAIGLFWWQRGSMDEEKVSAKAPLPSSLVVARLNEPIQPIPEILNLDPKKVALGERLFHEPLLSRDGTVSCASCHNLATGGVDRKRRSSGINGAVVVSTPQRCSTPVFIPSFSGMDGSKPSKHRSMVR